MDLEFADRKLKELAEEESSSGGYPVDVVKAFRKRVQFIRAAIDERDFYAMKSLHFKKLKGERSADRSMRLNDQWRLILRIKTGESKNIAVIHAIEDYH
jgi:proteic killer suppression protein